MALLIVLLALVLVQFKDSGNFLHNASWFQYWRKTVARSRQLRSKEKLALMVTVLVPTALAVLVLVAVDKTLGSFAELLFSVAALLYCFGRGNYHQILADYMRAWYQGDLHGAQTIVAPLLANVDASEREVQKPEVVVADESAHTINPDTLHQQVFRAAAYCAFERLFAVLFWFLLLGIPGALLYRLSQLYVAENDSATAAEDPLAAKHWLWLLEWLPARVMGLSFAVVGNFSGCYQAWHQYLLCRDSSTSDILEIYLSGALGGINNSACSAGATAGEGQRLCGAQLEALQALLSRALLLWITLLALYSLFGS